MSAASIDFLPEFLWLLFCGSVILGSSYCFILGKTSLFSRWSEIYPKSSLLHKLLCSLSSLFPSYLGFWAVPYLDITLLLVMPHLFIILSLQGTDSFSLFKFDLITFPLLCNLEIVWVVLSMKDTGCQIITLYYSLRCQRLARKLHLTCHYFCWLFACKEHWATQPQPNCILSLARTIRCQFRGASAYSDRACAPIIWQKCKSASCVSIWPNDSYVPLDRCPDLEITGVPEIWEISDPDRKKWSNICDVDQQKP